MSRVEFFQRGRSRTVHAFRVEAAAPGEHDVRLSLCERHQFSIIGHKYHSWRGDNFPPDDVMCKACLRELRA